MQYRTAASPGKNRAPATVIPVGRVRYTTHGESRVVTRSGLTHGEVEHLLEQGCAVYLGDNRNEGRSYFLFCSPKTREFFVAVASVEGPSATTWIITVLDKSMYERDRGMLLASHLEHAAQLSLPAEDFADWIRTFDAASQQIDPKLLSLRVTYRDAAGAPAIANIHPIAPAASDFFEGGRLQELREFEPFWRWANKSFAQTVGVRAAASAADTIESIQLCYRDLPVAEFVTPDDRQLLREFKPRFHRDDITLYLTFAHDSKLHSVQKNSPGIPADLLYEHLLPSLGREPALLAQLKNALSKKVPPGHLADAIRGLTEVQLQSPVGTIDFLTHDDRTIVDRLLAA